MGETLGSRFKSAWNAFRKQDQYEDDYIYKDLGYSFYGKSYDTYFVKRIRTFNCNLQYIIELQWMLLHMILIMSE